MTFVRAFGDVHSVKLHAGLIICRYDAAAFPLTTDMHNCNDGRHGLKGRNCDWRNESEPLKALATVFLVNNFPSPSSAELTQTFREVTVPNLSKIRSLISKKSLLKMSATPEKSVSRLHCVDVTYRYPPTWSAPPLPYRSGSPPGIPSLQATKFLQETFVQRRRSISSITFG
ncbi:hypothetical protein EJ06DRAFT_551611 [Trichodelitschia bisporula]|uniref:Uncharacterized protein n=1 Tax=Trichodelitschia bisporula TaxID=703511 RepID=A0A6G1HLM4_9PEZI|nr:hypothetical protein EJ06DRAFT_551611 [Trichodelitschia bisporula]